MRLIELLLVNYAGPNMLARETLEKAAARAVFIDAQNVYEYAEELYHRDDRPADDVVEFGSLPCIAPIAPTLWLEWRIRDPRLPKGTGCGIMVQSTQLEDGGWIAYTNTFTFMGKRAPVLSPIGSQFVVQPDGRLDRDGPDGNGNAFKHLMDLSVADQESATGLGRSSLYVVMWAMAFAHCKNVELERAPYRGPKKKRPSKRHRQRKRYRFHVLNIQPVCQAARKVEEGDTPDDRRKAALHICRGHFKDYSERGLFGREDLKGRYWWPMHTRGSRKEGIVVKDYSVGPGDDR